MSFQNQILEVSHDLDISDFFENKNLYQFLKTYIQIDYLLQNLQQTHNPLIIHYIQLENQQKMIL